MNARMSGVNESVIHESYCEKVEMLTGTQFTNEQCKESIHFFGC